MKRFGMFCLLIYFVSSFSSCKKDNDNPVETKFVLLAEQSIGTAGGSIGSSETILLEVPPGAFTATADLKVYSSDENNPFSSHGGSDMYYIAGIPSTLSKDLTISLPFNGTMDGSNYIVKGDLADATTTFDTVFSPEFLATTESAGYLRAVIPAQQGTVDALKGVEKANDEHGSQFYIVKGFKFALTEHFLIRHARELEGKPGIDSLARGLEKAYDLLLSWGFTYENRKSWPLTVVIRTIISENSGEPSEMYGRTLYMFPHTYNTGKIEINEKYINNNETMRFTGAHEFFHIVQDFYSMDKKYNWLREASSTWLEEYFADDPGAYMPSTANENYFEPFEGLQYGIRGGVAEHGYGCAGVINYLMDINNAANDPSAILSIWQLASSGIHPVEVIMSFPSDFTGWWDDFLYNYFIGDVYPKVNANFGKYYFNTEKGKTFLFSVKSKNDTEKQFDHTGMDLSGQVYKIALESNDLTQNAKCHIKLEGGNAKLYVFRYNPDQQQTQLLDEVEMDGEAVVSNLKDFKDQQHSIILLLCNKGAQADWAYEGLNQTHILIEITDEEDEPLTYYETTCNAVSTYYSGSFNIAIESENEYPFRITKDEYYSQGGMTIKQLRVCFDLPPAGETVTFNVTVDTLSLSSTYPGKITIAEACWQVGDIHNLTHWINLDPTIIPFPMQAQYNNTFPSGTSSFWLGCKTTEPLSANNLYIMSIDFFSNCGK